jgi:hypothetical protein
MKLRIMIGLAASCLLGSASAFAQGQESAEDPAPAQPNPAVIDTTFKTENGQLLRFRGARTPVDQPAGAQRFEANRDDRVPLGYGWKSLSDWREGDPRPKPFFEPGRITTEFMDVHYHPGFEDNVAKTFAESGDFMYFAIKDRLGWTIDKPVTVIVARDMKEYAKLYGLPWWIPAEVRGDSILVEDFSAILGRGLILESITHSYAELLIRRKTGDRIPYWFIYGASAFLGGEGGILKNQADMFKPPQWNIQIDQATMIRDLEIFRDPTVALRDIDSPGKVTLEMIHSRIAFWRAFKIVEDLMLKKGIASFKQLIASMEADPSLSFEAAVQKQYGMSVDALVAAHAPW